MYYAVPRLLHRHGMLHCLYTDMYGGKWPFSAFRWLPKAVRPAHVERLLTKDAALPPDKVRAFQWFGLRYVTQCWRARTPSELTRIHLWAGERFSELIVASGLPRVDWVFGFNSASEVLFRRAKEVGIRTLLEQMIIPLATQIKMMEEERRRWPEWEAHERDENAAAFIAREENEWRLADVILCASQFVADGVMERGGEGAKCRVVPYGIDVERFAAPSDRPVEGSSPLRALFIGAVGLRKGAPYLLQAMKAFDPSQAVLRVVGKVTCRDSALRASCPPNVEILGPLTRPEVARQFQWADIFCLPSICEGSATATYEALAAGLPVITTPNAGSIVRDGVEGFVLPVRSPEAIAEALRRFLGDRGLLRTMSAAARQRSAFGSLEAYGERLVKVLHESAVER
jgi:glycosyltransferase involved in cell wall biosynthesis